MGIVIGIDLGTTNSGVAFFEGDQPGIILTPEGDRLLPSMVAFTPNGDRLVGNPARSQLITNTDTVYSVKRLMGKRFSEVKPYLHQFTYRLVEGQDDTIKIKINNTLFSPEEISAMIIEKLKEAAEAHLDDIIDGAIITVPAYFNDSQRQATKDAGEIAGLNVLRIINEPTAASLAFSLDLSKKSTVVVYDFGGGTIDISVLDVQNDIIKVLATAGNINLGGSDFDVMLSIVIQEEIKQEHNIDLSEDRLALQRIRDAAESAKKELSGVDECEINLPFIADSDRGAVHYSKYITRNDLEMLIGEDVAKTIEICKSALKAAGLTINDIDEVVLVGGSTRIPFVQQMVKELFNKEPNKKVNPDEIVAMGAAMQGAIAKGKTRDILLLDVTPLSLGVKTYGGAFTRVIEANTTIPTNKSLVFSTVEDKQQEVEIMVYQGEREIAEENKFLGKFILPDIKPAPKGTPRIEVSFSININGILKVNAVDLSTRSEKEVLITHSGLLSEEEISEIKKSAEKYRESDLKKKDLVKIKNNIVNYIYSIKKILKTSQVPGQQESKSRNLIKKAGAAMKNEIPDELEQIQKQLAELENRLSASGYNEADMNMYEDNDAESEMDTDAELELDMDMEDEMEDEIETDTNAEMIIVRETPGRFKEEGAEENEADLINKEALNIKKEILNYVYALEQYINNVKLGEGLMNEAHNLIANAHIEIGKKKPRALGKIHKGLGELTIRIEDIVARTLGITDEKTPDGKGDTDKDGGKDTKTEKEKEKEKAPPKRKDDTNPLRAVKKMTPDDTKKIAALRRAVTK